MIDPNTRIIDVTWGQAIQELDARYGLLNSRYGNIMPAKSADTFLNIKDCAALTGYSPGYIRQLVFKRAIPFHKNPNLKPVRFKRDEILAWMGTKKFTPIDEQAEDYISDRALLTSKSRK